MSSNDILMYETLLEDEPIDWAEVHQCYGCFKYHETTPVIGDDGNLYCSETCEKDEPADTLLSDERDI